MSGKFELAALWVAVVGAALALFALIAIVGFASIRAQRDEFGRRVNRQLRDLFISIDPMRLWAIQWFSSALIAGITGLITFNPYATVAAALLAGTLPRVLLSYWYRHQLQRLRSQMPDFLTLVAGALRSGSGLTVALSRAAGASPAPARLHFEWLQSKLRLGTPLGSALEALERRVRIEEVTLLSTALRVGADTGGPLSQALEGLADSMRRRLATKARIRALTAQGRLQAWIMALLPAVVLALLAVVDPPSFNELAFTASGRSVLGAVFLAQIIGFRLVRRIVAIEV